MPSLKLVVSNPERRPAPPFTIGQLAVFIAQGWRAGTLTPSYEDRRDLLLLADHYPQIAEALKDMPT